MTVHIRPLTLEDKSEWSRLWRGYLSFYKTTLPDHIYDVYFERLLGDDPRDFNGLIAEIDGKPVGLTHYIFHRHGWKVEDVCYLQDLWADPHVRGKGIGRALIEAVYEKAAKAGNPSVYWNTAQDNAQARQLYDRIASLTPFLKYQGP
ncbi:GNAT family N-acetyltransferase [Falsihalocynthiibacter arcticus]|uniref:GCN5 family acetyltransferase n=1 Tax=Falsihalocynthiibacter arcticus TaxID=1579316 RepID=A0A126V2J8_9RHOB|nr:GNAT family N-acetyltransferase [Falsihalocynthiibacter arcticus]AML52513.1 GCN5 family acetyltransferase [Falsihalocynthiibacter arcticus]